MIIICFYSLDSAFSLFFRFNEKYSRKHSQNSGAIVRTNVSIKLWITDYILGGRGVYPLALGGLLVH